MTPMIFLRKTSVLVLLTLTLSLTLFVGTVEATDGLQGDECVVEDFEVVTEDFYFFCNTLTIYGVIDGDLIGVASEVTIARDARILGGIWVAGGSLTIEGIVEEDVHFGGIDLDIMSVARFPNPETDVVAAGVSLDTANNVVIPGDLIYYGYQAIIGSRVNGNVDFQGQALVVNGTIAGNVDAVVGDQDATAPISTLPVLYSVELRDPGIWFEEDGYIAGDLRWEAPQLTSVARRVGGVASYRQASDRASITDVDEPDTFLQVLGNFILRTTRDVVSLGLVGMLTLNFFSRMLIEPGFRVQTRFISAFSWGLVLFLATIPVMLLLLLASILILLIVFIITLNELTILTSIALIVINLGFVGGFFFLLAFLGRVITCFVVGYFLVRLAQRAYQRLDQAPPTILEEVWLSVIVGVVAISLMVNLPLGAFVGQIQFLFTSFIALTGLGAIVMYFRDLYYTTTNPFVTGTTRSAPPPPDDFDYDVETPVGMDNLPPGFRWFDDP